jgi:hypothetical protein
MVPSSIGPNVGRAFQPDSIGSSGWKARPTARSSGWKARPTARSSGWKARPTETPGNPAHQGTLTSKGPRSLGPWFPLGSSPPIDQGIEWFWSSWRSIQYQQLGFEGPRDRRCLVGLGRPGHWVIKFPAMNSCQGTMKPSLMHDQSRPGINSADERAVASFEQDLGDMRALDPWHRRRMGSQGPGPLGPWVPAGAWLLGR